MEVIKERIKELGFKQSALAKKLGISQTLLSMYLSETRPIPEEKRKQLLQILHKYESV